MKKVFYSISIIVITIFTSCTDFNERNFPELDLEANPTNLLTINYEMTASDFTTIANIVKKPINDSINSQKALLAKAKTKVDSKQSILK